MSRAWFPKLEGYVKELLLKHLQLAATSAVALLACDLIVVRPHLGQIESLLAQADPEDAAPPQMIRDMLDLNIPAGSMKLLAIRKVNGALAVPTFCHAVQRLDALLISGLQAAPVPEGLSARWNACDWCDGNWTLNDQPHLERELKAVPTHLAARRAANTQDGFDV